MSVDKPNRCPMCGTIPCTCLPGPGKYRTSLILAASTLALLSACGNRQQQPQQVQYAPQQAEYAEQICLDPRSGVRVADFYCSRPGYSWDYYRSRGQIAVPALGARPPSGWTTQRPNVTNIVIHNNAPASGGTVGPGGGSPATATTTQAPVRSQAPTVQRGGLGVRPS